MLASVSVIYLRIDHKVIPIFKQNKRENVLGKVW